MTQIFEAGMLICFGISWPFNIMKSVRSRTAKGKSLSFELCVLTGYAIGLAGKFISGNISYVLVVYILDTIMVLTDVLLTLRNQKLDRMREAA